MDKVELNKKQINAILNASYALTNKMGAWLAEPDDVGDQPVLETMALAKDEMTELFSACPDLSGRQHTPAEIGRIAAAGVAMIGKFASAYPSIDRIPEVMRQEIKGLYWALNDAGLIEAKE
jgi:hypothetical protein